MRGPAILSRTPGQPVLPTSRERFDQLVVGCVAAIEDRWAAKLGLVEYAVEDTPQLPDDWSVEHRVPLSSLIRGHGGTPSRLVIFRRPLEHRAENRADLEALVRTVLVQQVAELLGMSPEDVDPGWTPLED